LIVNWALSKDSKTESYYHRYQCFVLLKFWRLTIIFDFSGNKRCSRVTSGILHVSSLVPILPIFSYQDLFKINIIRIPSTCNITFLSKEYVLSIFNFDHFNSRWAIPGKNYYHSFINIYIVNSKVFLEGAYL